MASLCPPRQAFYPVALLALLFTVSPASAGQLPGGFADCFSESWSSAVVLLPDSPALALRGVSLTRGDQIAALAPDGTCVGVTEWDGGATALTVWADDPVTTRLDGLQPGDPVAIAVWDRSADRILRGHSVTPTFDAAFAPEHGFAPDAVYLLAADGPHPHGEEGARGDYALGAPFPNPTSDRARVPLSLAAETMVTVEVFDTLGRRVAVPLEGAALGAGDHHVGIDVAGLASGVYLIRVRMDEGVLQTRLSVSR